MDNAKGEMPGNQYYESVARVVYLYPNHVLSWLKLREMRGLENPKEYSHKIMNMKLVQGVIALETPLVKPMEIPYAKKLLLFLKKHCPNTKIPSWVDSLDNRTHYV